MEVASIFFQMACKGIYGVIYWKKITICFNVNKVFKFIMQVYFKYVQNILEYT